MPNMQAQDINSEVTIILLKRIIELLDTKEEAPETLKADEVRAALRNELSGVIKSIKALPDNTDILKELKALQTAIKAIELSPNINVEAAQVTLPEIKIPDINVPETIIPPFNIPVPQVNYTPPEINIPAPLVNVAAPVLNVPEVDLSSIIRSLEVNLNKLRTNSVTRPLAVRMTDGQEWIKAVDRMTNETSKAVAAFAGGSNQVRLLDPNMQVINPSALTTPSYIGDGYKAVTTAGVKEALASSTQCRYVIIMALAANTGNIYIGGVTVSSTSGRALVSLQSEKIDIDNLNKIYLDAEVSGEGVMYTYVA